MNLLRPHLPLRHEQSFLKDTAPSNLKTLEQGHSGEKSFKCMGSEKAFRQSSHLKAHKLTHTKEKPFKCMLCEKAFSLSFSLKIQN